MSNPIFKPSWAVHEKDLHSSDLDTAVKAGEAFDQERQKETATSPKARAWEKERKTEIAKQKPAWVKARREQDAAPLKKMAADLKKGVVSETGIRPMPGFVLIKPEFPEQTDSGIYFSATDPMLVDTGVVLAIGAELVNLYKVVPPPAQAGDRVMIKKGLPGLEMSVKGEYCLLMTWADLLGVFEE